MHTKKFLKSVICTIIAIVFVNSVAFAANFDPSDFTSIEFESNILPEGVKESVDYIRIPRRGVFFAAADLKIANYVAYT